MVSASSITQGSITSGFGMRKLNGNTHMHNGVDIGAPIGTPVKAPADGVVIFAGKANGFGPNYVEIRHPNGHVSVYGHMSTKNVKVGQRIKKGEEIGKVGNEGWSTGPHLHYGEKDASGKYIDPLTSSIDPNTVTMGGSINKHHNHDHNHHEHGNHSHESTEKAITSADPKKQPKVKKIKKDKETVAEANISDDMRNQIGNIVQKYMGGPPLGEVDPDTAALQNTISGVGIGQSIKMAA